MTAPAEAEIPPIGLGTWRMWGDECRSAVESALECGYRHVDTADHYDNHEAVGAALAASDVPRDEVFLTTKVAGTDLASDDLTNAVPRYLDELGVSYLDLLLVHWPNQSVPISETMAAMNDLVDDGVVRNVGVSQFSVPRLREAMAASDAPLLTNQVEYHPYYRQTAFKDERPDTAIDLFDFCRSNDVAITAYSPLAEGNVLDDDVVGRIGARYGKSPVQTVLRWHLQQGIVAIPKASSKTHQRQNLDVFDFELTRAEMEAIAARRASPTYYLRREDGPLFRALRTARARLSPAYYRLRSRVPHSQLLPDFRTEEPEPEDNTGGVT